MKITHYAITLITIAAYGAFFAYCLVNAPLFALVLFFVGMVFMALPFTLKK